LTQFFYINLKQYNCSCAFSALPQEEYLSSH